MLSESEWVEDRTPWWVWAIHGTRKVISNYIQGNNGTEGSLPFFWRNSHTQEYTSSAHLDLMSDYEACVCVLVGGGKGIFM